VTPGTVITDCRGELERFEFDPASLLKPEGGGGMLGFGGALWRIRFADGSTVETNDLWHQGEIPARFAHLFPVNACFLDEHGEPLLPLLTVPWDEVREGDRVNVGGAELTVKSTEVYPAGDGEPSTTAYVQGFARDGRFVTRRHRGSSFTYVRRACAGAPREKGDL
jgi:hypothetical protein